MVSDDAPIAPYQLTAKELVVTLPIDKPLGANDDVAIFVPNM